MTKRKTRENRVNIRLNDDEYTKLKLLADGLSLAKYLRLIIEYGEPPRRTKDFPKIDPEFMRKITSLSNNLNQITRYVHTIAKEEPLDAIKLALAIEIMTKELKELKELYTVE